MSWWDDAWSGINTVGKEVKEVSDTIYANSPLGIATQWAIETAQGKTYALGDIVNPDGTVKHTGIGATLAEQNDETKAAADAAAAENAAAKDAINANWETAASAAGITYKRMLEDAATAEAQNEANFDSNISAMKNQYGYTDASGNRVLGEQSQSLVTLNNNIKSADSKRLATVGASGVKNTGSVAAIDISARQAEADAINVTTASEKASAVNAATQTGNTYKTQKTAIDRQVEDAATLQSNWGSFDWSTFSGGTNTNSLYYKQYKAQLASNNASGLAASLNYSNQLRDTDPYNLWNYAQGASTLLSLGKTVASLF